MLAFCVCVFVFVVLCGNYQRFYKTVSAQRVLEMWNRFDCRADARMLDNRDCDDWNDDHNCYMNCNCYTNSFSQRGCRRFFVFLLLFAEEKIKSDFCFDLTGEKKITKKSDIFEFELCNLELWLVFNSIQWKSFHSEICGLISSNFKNKVLHCFTSSLNFLFDLIFCFDIF